MTSQIMQLKQTLAIVTEKIFKVKNHILEIIKVSNKNKEQQSQKVMHAFENGSFIKLN